MYLTRCHLLCSRKMRSIRKVTERKDEDERRAKRKREREREREREFFYIKTDEKQNIVREQDRRMNGAGLLLRESQHMHTHTLSLFLSLSFPFTI